MARLTLQQRAYLLGLRRGQVRARAERERLADKFEATLKKIHAEMADLRARLHRRKLEEAERGPGVCTNYGFYHVADVCELVPA